MAHEFEHKADEVVFQRSYEKALDNSISKDFVATLGYVAKQMFLEGMEYQRAINETQRVA